MKTKTFSLWVAVLPLVIGAFFAPMAFADGDGKGGSGDSDFLSLDSLNFLTDSGLYVKGKTGKLKIRDVCKVLNEGYVHSNQNVSVQNCTNSAFGNGIDAGYQFHENLAAEVGGVWAAGYDAELPITVNGVTSTMRIETHSRFFSTGLRSAWAVNEKLSVHGRLGYQFWAINASDGMGGKKSHSDGKDPYVGIGASYNFSDNIDVQADYTYTKFGASKGDYLSLSAGYRF